MKYTVLAVPLALASASITGAPRIVPIDLLDHLPAEAATLERLAESTVEWRIEDGRPQFVQFDLPSKGIDPRDYDELRFDLQPIGSQVGLFMTLYHHPQPEQQSGWYLKFPAPEDVWSSGRFDLHLDDDGVFRKPPKPEEKPGMMGIRLYRRIIGFPGEPVWRKARFRNVRLVKRIVSADFDLLDTEVIQDRGEVACVYRLQVANLTDLPVSASIELDGQRTLRYFQVDGPTRVELEPRETKAIPIKVWMPTKDAMRLPPLFAEPVVPVVSVAGVPDSDVYPLRGYRRFPMWGVVPVFNPVAWEPVSFEALIDARGKLFPDLVRKWREQVVRSADQALQHDWPVPTFAVPTHDQRYRCKPCGQWLKPKTPTEFHHHVCPQCGKEFINDETMDCAWLGRYHRSRAHDVRELALAWLATGEDRYAAKARDILLAYAKAYPTMPCRGTRSTSGFTKMGNSSLHSSYVLPHFAEGYSFLRQAPLIGDDDHARIRRFLLDSGTRICQHSVEYNNQQAEHFRAYGSAGIATGFWPLAAEAIYGDFGWHEVVEYGYSEDGIAHEGGVYHRSVMSAMNAFAEFAFGETVNLYTTRFKRVFDGTLAAGDSAPRGGSYELPYRVYRELAYVPVVAAERSRSTLTTILHGVPGLPDPAAMPAHSRHMEGTGCVLLRRGTAANFAEIAINYIKPFDRHERDKLTTFFRVNGQQVDSTCGRITYGSPHSRWMESTAAHNTIVIDGGDERAQVDGQCLVFDPSPESPIAVLQSDPEAPLYEGVRHVRGMALVDGFFVVFDRVTCDSPRTIDRYQWGKGTAKLLFDAAAPDAGLPCLPEHGAFSGVVGGRCGRELRTDYGNGLKMRLVSDGDMEAYKALTVAGYQARPAEVTWARRAGADSATFLAAFSYEKEGEPPALEIVETTNVRMQFRMALGDRTRTISVDLAKRKAAVE